MACRAFDIDVRQELHVERNRSRAVARRATQLASVIGECPRFQTDGPRSICFCERASKIVMDAAICSDGGTYVRADRRGIDKMCLGHTVRLEEPHLRRLRRPVDPRLQAGLNISSTIVVLPEPDTPVTAVSRPRGISTDNGPTVCRRSVSI